MRGIWILTGHVTFKLRYNQIYQMRTPVVYINCFECQNKNKHFMYSTCSELVVFMYWTGKSMNNLLSYCGLVDARISTSEKIYLYQLFQRSYFQFWLREAYSAFNLCSAVYTIYPNAFPTEFRLHLETFRSHLQNSDRRSS